MLSGCVPVIFERTAALTQWPLHWRIPKDEALTLRQSLHSISIPDNLKEEISHSARARTSTITNDRSDYLADHSVNVAADCVLYVPRDVAMRNMSETFAYLARLSRDSAFMATKLRCIARVGHQMQYSMPRGFAPVAGTKQGFSTPQKDAVDIFLEYLLNWSSK